MCYAYVFIYYQGMDLCATFHSAKLKVCITDVVLHLGSFVSVHNATVPLRPEEGFP